MFVEAVAAATFEYGETAAQETYFLSSELARRSGGAAQEAATVQYLSDRLVELGYTPTLQPFTYDFQGTP